MTRPPTRRDFVRRGTAAAAAVAAAPYAPRALFHNGVDETLRVGLIGCGGRGTGAAAQALRADPNARLVAMGDAFGDQIQRSLETLRETADVAARVSVDADHCFTGFDNYRGVIASSDVVLLCTTPHFRPQQFAAAVAAGKHAFVEKPVAVDPAGVRAVREASQQAAARGLTVVSGLCYRYSFAKQETLKRVHGGEVGDVVSMQCTYNTGGLWHRGRQPNWSEMEYQMRNWYYYTWLSGDHIVEQHIHSLDKLAWAMQGYPEKCTASGGRIQRTDPKYGNIYDHFNSVFEWPGGVKGFSSCRQWNGASSDVSDYVHGTRGVASLQGHRIEGENRWRWRSDDPDDMYQNEHDVLFASVREGRAHNDGETMADSTLMAILARMSAYTGKTLTWEQAQESQLDLTPASYEWSAHSVQPPAVPGVTKFI